MGYSVIDPSKINLPEIMYIKEKYSPLLPFEGIEKFSPESLAIVATKLWGNYAFITSKLVEFCKYLIKDRKSIEICSGHGTLGKALGIPSTDRKLMNSSDPFIKQVYKNFQKIDYPEYVEELTANEAIEKYEPEIVIGCWCTQIHKHESDIGYSSMYGVEEEKIIEKTDMYVHIGNTNVHKKRILSERHYRITADWLGSRTLDGENEILIFTDEIINFEDLPLILNFVVEKRNF